MAEDIEQTPEGQLPAKPAKTDAKKSVKKVKQQKSDDGMYLPVLVEFTFTSSVVFLILVFLAMAVTSLLAGSSLSDFVLRTSAAMGVLGILLLVVLRQVSAGVLSASLVEIEEKTQQPAPEEPEPLHETDDNPESKEIPVIVEAQ